MGWSGRAPAPPAIEAGWGANDMEHAMSQNLNSAIAFIGTDIVKNSFHVVGLNARVQSPCGKSGRVARLKPG